MESLIRSSLIGTRPGIYDNKKSSCLSNCHVEQMNFFKAQNNALSWIQLNKILKSESSTTPFLKEFSAIPEFRFSLFYGRTTLNFVRSNNSHYLLFSFGGLHWITSKWEWLISVGVKGIILCPPDVTLHDIVFQTCSQHVHCWQWANQLNRLDG